ncbi:MAG: asparagine synthase (glutamine-hydrolyzing) [Verrucomicrobia bacterium]|nr:asparagine synthase (glutamine-hydrolyzing) [Verrucomicrobiota bacterium]
MCGICGQFNFGGNQAVDPEAVRLMAGSIRHRGPDDEGYYFDDSLGFGFRRLSIIDLAGGHQPMSDSEEKIWTIFNGEIYNYRELRAELEGLGHRFRTRSDTEVIIHGYKEWGTKVFNRLNGMFGVAVWDAWRGRLVVARDAMGIKMIYYRLANGQLTFGSEIRAVLAAETSSIELDPVAVSLFLEFRYTPSPLTVFEGVRKLAPGCMLVVETGKCREERWYDYKPVPFEPPKDEKIAEDELLELYEAAVERHLLSDVPVGILLSGGVDSALLLALMNQHGKDWPAYTVGYGQTFADDELADAAETAALLGARHIRVELDQEEFERSLPKIVDALEEPIAASSIVPMYFVCQRAREDVKVVLIGQGPDEVFGGYKRHVGVHYGGLWRGVPRPVRGLLGTAVQALPRNETLKRGIHSLDVGDRLKRYQQVFSLAPSHRVHSLFQDDVLPNSAGGASLKIWQELVPHMEHLDELGGFQLLELRSSLPDELLMYGDKLSMAHGLEARVPYLDRTVVEYAQRLGSKLKVRNGKGKWLHRQVSRRLLDSRILQRKKRGFAVNVVDDWFQSSLKGALPKMLTDKESLMFAFLKPDSVQNLLADHQSGRQDNHKLLFSLVMLEQWLRQTSSNSRSVSEVSEHEPCSLSMK